MEQLAESVQSLEQCGGGQLPRNRLSSSLSLHRARVGPEFMVFIEEAVKELLNDRRVLRSSYGFGYFIQGHVARRQFENMQVSIRGLGSARWLQIFACVCVFTLEVKCFRS